MLIVYLDTNGVVRGDSIEKVLGMPGHFEKFPKPVFLTIEVEDQSVVFSTSDCRPENIVRFIQKAYQLLYT